MDKRKVRELKAKAQSLNATVYVGKDGISESVVQELSIQLDKIKLVKVKLQPSSEMDRDEAGRKLAESTRSVLVEVRGRTAVLAKD
jgi:RNA-binding protein